jgi:hypothetical protein
VPRRRESLARLYQLVAPPDCATAPCTDNGFPMAHHGQGEHQQLRGQPVQRVGQITGRCGCSHRAPAIRRGQRLRQSIKQGAGRAEQEKPQQHGKTSAQRSVGYSNAKCGRVPCDAVAIVDEFCAAASRLAPSGAFRIASRSLSNSRGPKQYSSTMSENSNCSNSPERRMIKQPRQQQAHASGGSSRPVPRARCRWCRPAALSSVGTGITTPARQLRHDMQQAEGDKGGEQADGHECGLADECRALYASVRFHRRWTVMRVRAHV